MEFVRLGAPYATTYVPDKLIEGYNSLIWTERYQEFGEFELKSFDIFGMVEALPEDALVSHLDTREVMKVDTHEINMVGEGEDAQPEITIRGRSAASILESRWVESEYQKKRRMRKKYSGTGALGVLLVNAVDNASGADLTRGESDSSIGPDEDPAQNHYDWNTKDVIPFVAVTESVASEGESRWWQLEEGTLWPQMLKIMQSQHLAVRVLRPVSPNPATVITVAQSIDIRGNITRTNTPDVTQLRFHIYAGQDRTASVKFSLLQGHIDAPTYLSSTRDHKTLMEIMSGEIHISDVYMPGDSGLTGWRRKVEGFDAGSPEIPEEPERPTPPKSDADPGEIADYEDELDEWIDKHARWKNKRDRLVDDFKEEQAKAAIRALYGRRKVNMFSGDISSLSPYVYGKDYYLGDAVSLFGDYGKSAIMLVSEYVRTEDVEGDRGFPTLIAP